MVQQGCCPGPQDRDVLRRAQVRLGILYENGDGVEMNHKTALDWYHKAARHKLTMAYRGIGRILRSGSAGEQDVAEAARWFERAAEAGKSDAQFALAEIYLNGEGNVTVDRERGMQWLKEAAAHKYAPAIALLKSLETD